MSDLTDVLSSIADRLQASVNRLNAAPANTAENAQRYADGKYDPRSAAAFHQLGSLEQICRSEAAALECAVKWLRSMADAK